jgi:signal transduction histidine kinase/DNA-binding response OmpR family regulator
MVVLYSGYASDDLTDWLDFSLFTNHPAYLSFLKLSIYVGMMCYLSFIRSFLDLEQLLPRWDAFFKMVIYLGIPMMVIYVGGAYFSNFSYVIEDRITIIYIALVIVSSCLFLYPLYKTKDTKGYFIVAGITTISLGFLFTLISRVWLPPFSLFYLKVCTVIEILIFSLGLAYRQRKQEQDKQVADFALRESQLIQEKKQLEANRLQELSDFKSRFYTNITHEFRTPLTVIMGMSENLQNNPQEKKLIQRNSQNLLRLINQLLDLSKLESGSLSLNKTNQDIIVYLQYLTESFYSNASHKNIRLVFHSEEKEVMMDYDEEKIQQIVYNLLANALKFTPEAGKIIFHASKEEQQGKPVLKLKVQDTGIGIRPENIKHIFDRFYQINHPDKNKGEGTGIGLALVKELVELMNGQITVESQIGEGTTFVLYLPIEAKVSPGIRQAATGQQGAAFGLSGENVFIPPDEEIDITEAATSSSFPELLIIEDNQDIITYIKSILKNSYNLHIARNGAAGIEKALEVVPDIIISDVMMPEKDGYEVCETLKQDERTSHIPIILLTAKSTQQDKVEGLTYGADAYLTKPFDKKELIIRLKKLVAIRQQLQQRYTTTSSRTIAQEATLSIEEAFLQKLHEQIQRNLSDTEFGVPQLADAVHLSQMQLYRKLKALTGKTPSQFIRSYRLEKGLELLKAGQLTVAEVAYEVGFSDPSYFSRTFQKEFKRNPSRFLKS